MKTNKPCNYNEALKKAAAKAKRDKQYKEHLKKQNDSKDSTKPKG